MNIVVLDGYTLNPGDLTWADLETLGSCTIYDRTPPEKIVERAAHCEILLTNKTVLAKQTLEKLPKLRYIGVLATGYNVVDVAAAKHCGITVANVPTYGTASVAQMVFAHLLNLTQHVADHGRSVAAGDWTRSADFCYWNSPLIELSGQTLGVIGFGRIGRAVATIAKAFGMSVLAHDVLSATSPVDGVEFVGLEELFRRSDVVSLHCPLTPETKHLVNAERLQWMKPTAFLINTSRGPLIDDQALADALNADRLAGAGIDVVSEEPPPASNPLLKAKHCCITPHIAWATYAARKRLLAVTVANIRGFLDGKPQNVVS
jgi:glycerate dehydrogenase